MNPRTSVRTLGLALGLTLIARQVYSNGTCSLSVPNGSVSFTRPSTSACYTPNASISPSASYRINWEVLPQSYDNNHCDAPLAWNQTGSTDDPGDGCSVNFSSTDSINNAASGTTSNFTRTRSWNCSATTLGNWTMTGEVKYGGAVKATNSVNYSNKANCP